MCNIKKVIKGSVFNTDTAKKICEQWTKDESHEYGAYVKRLKELYRTKSGNYFFYIRNDFSTYVDKNNDDLNPNFVLEDVSDEKIIPVSYDLSVQFASEVILSTPEQKDEIELFFPELSKDSISKNHKIQKKFYISEKANWCLEILMQENEYTNSSYMEKLIIDEFKRVHGNDIQQ